MAAEKRSSGSRNRYKKTWKELNSSVRGPIFILWPGNKIRWFMFGLPLSLCVCLSLSLSLSHSLTHTHTHTHTEESKIKKRKADNTGLQLRSADARYWPRWQCFIQKSQLPQARELMGAVQSQMGWAEKPLLKGTVSPSFKHCAIAVDSPENEAANKSILQRAIRISETELRAACEAKRLKHKQHQIP